MTFIPTNKVKIPYLKDDEIKKKPLHKMNTSN